MVKSFKELGLSNSLLQVLSNLGFTEPSEIQEKAIPLVLQGKDILGGSATGSGKTLAFGAPFIEKIQHGNGLQVLVLTPTRELAEQVSKALSVFAQNKLKIISVYGGVSLVPQFEDLRDCDVVVGTPGRILDHLSRKTINLSKVNYLVLDEADRMLDMGFQDDVERIISRCPKQRQTLLFSATILPEIIAISKKYMNSPIEVSVESYVDASKLEQVYYDVNAPEKFSLLVHLLKQEDSNLVMVFSNTKRNADVLARNLKAQGINAMALHGDLSQNKRIHILEKFHKSEKFILVCTDVAARGLDIKNVSHVYNYDSPKNSTDYIHRVGRTARAGKEGKAISILGDRDYENFRKVLQDRSLNIKRLETPQFERIFMQRAQSRDDFRQRHDFRDSRGSSGRSSGYPRQSYNRERTNRSETTERTDNYNEEGLVRSGYKPHSQGSQGRSRFGSSRFSGRSSSSGDSRSGRRFPRARNFTRQKRHSDMKFRNRW